MGVSSTTDAATAYAPFITDVYGLVGLLEIAQGKLRSMRRVHHTGFVVSELDNSVKFYEDHFNFRLLFKGEKENGYLTTLMDLPRVSLKLAQLSLGENEQILELLEFRYPAPEAGPTKLTVIGSAHLCIDVVNIGETVNRLQRAGVEKHGNTVQMDSGVNLGGETAYFRDPDGILIQVRQTPMVEEAVP